MDPPPGGPPGCRDLQSWEIAMVEPHPTCDGYRRRCARASKNVRRGGITVLSAFLIVALLIVAAFAIDVGMVCVAKAELQRTADAAALAGTDALLQQAMKQRTKGRSMSLDVQNAAISVAALNEIHRQAPHLVPNPNNDPAGDIVVGEFVRSADGTPSLAFNNPARFNSVLVRVKRTEGSNGQLASFFGRAMGKGGTSAEATAQAVFAQDFIGISAPHDDGSTPPPDLPILPFAIKEEVWLNRFSNDNPDEYRWDGTNVVKESDGTREINLYPLSSGAGGNWGTVDIGSNNSTTPVLRRQIVNGVSSEDLAFHGGALRLVNGELKLSGDPGLKLGAVEPEMRTIIDSKCRCILIYRSAKLAGNPAEFTIVGFGAVQIMAVELTGSTRYIKVQPCGLICRTCIPGPPSPIPSSDNIFSTIFIAN
jgi:hypothetical protein